MSLSLLFGLALLMSACGESPARQATPHLNIVGALETPATASPTPRPSLTPTVTPFPSRTPYPTARAVSVSRISAEIDPFEVTPLAPGVTLPDITLTDIDGVAHRLSDYQGRAVVLNFWALGCGSCFYEFPILQAFAAYHGENVQVIGVNVSDFAEETRIVAEQMGATFPQVVDQRAEFFAGYFNGAVVPTTIFIHPDGRVSFVAIGPMDAYNIDLQLQAVGLPAYTP